MTQPPAAEPIIAAEAVDEQIKPAPHPIFPEGAAPAEPLAPHPRPGHAPFERPFAPPPAAPHPIEPSFAPPPSPAPPVPTTSWADWLAAFMEERNIRWGELVGGLLIVCCSIALVISFWSRIAEMPLVQFLLFNGVTAALFGVGFYSEHRWRLHTTSQGLLTIASMLVPLNFLAIAAVTTAAAANNPLVLGGEAVSTVLFAALLFFGGRVLVGSDALALTVGIIVPALVQLLVRRFVDAEVIPGTLWALAAAPLACYGTANGWSLAHAARKPGFSEEAANRLFKFLGLTTFAVVLPLALILAKSTRPMPTLHEMAGAVSLLGAVPLAAGLFVWRRLDGRNLAGPRTAGTSIAVFGAIVSLAGLVVGWPDPAMMLPIALIEFVVFTLVAWHFRLPAGHLLAAACLAIAYLVARISSADTLAGAKAIPASWPRRWSRDTAARYFLRWCWLMRAPRSPRFVVGGARRTCWPAPADRWPWPRRVWPP